MHSLPGSVSKCFRIRGRQLLSLVGRIVKMGMATGQYIDKRNCFQYVDIFFLHNSWRYLRASCYIVAARIWPAGRNLPTLASLDAAVVHTVGHLSALAP